MKLRINPSYRGLLLAMIVLVTISNCNLFNPKKKDDNLLLLGALLLSQQQPTWSVAVTAVLKQTNGTNIAVNHLATLNEREADVSTNQLSTRALVKNDDEKIVAFATTAASGRFSFNFRTNNPNQPLRLNYTTLKASGNADLADDYTVDSGNSVFTFIANDAEPESLGQISGLTTTGAQLVIEKVLSVRSGTYNLPNPTVGELVCDGKRLVGNPVVKSGTISTAETWSGGIILQGTVFADAPITVSAGTVIFGSRGSSLFIRGGNKLTAIGTADNPICWTSASAPGSRFPGDWGGIVTIGNSGSSRTSTTEGTTPQAYGTGSLPGTLNLEMQYNIVEFGGNEVAPGDELNNISMYASNTSLTNVQAHRGLDDQFEAWGGNLSWSNLLATGGLDDDYDLDEGVGGTISNAISHKYPSSCGGSASTDPHGLEWDGIHNNGTPECGTSLIGRCTTVTLNKFTLIGSGMAAGQAGRLRERVVATLTNGVHYGFAQGFDARDIGTNVTVTNVRTDKANQGPAGGASIQPVTADLTSLPIVSDGGISSNCGFTENKPDYSLTGTASSALGATDGVGKFWEGWAVFRGR
jgi:hypothetical protein